MTAAYYPVVGVLTVAQGGLNTNTPYDQRVVPSSITSPSVSGQDEPSSQIKSEVNDEIADKDCRFASKTENVDSSMAENMKREKGFTDLQTNVSNDSALSSIYQIHDSLTLYKI